MKMKENANYTAKDNNFNYNNDDNKEWKIKGKPFFAAGKVKIEIMFK